MHPSLGNCNCYVSCRCCICQASTVLCLASWGIRHTFIFQIARYNFTIARYNRPVVAKSVSPCVTRLSSDLVCVFRKIKKRRAFCLVRFVGVLSNRNTAYWKSLTKCAFLTLKINTVFIRLLAALDYKPRLNIGYLSLWHTSLIRTFRVFGNPGCLHHYNCLLFIIIPPVIKTKMRKESLVYKT